MSARMAAAEPDFDALYRELGITARSGLPLLRQRYRRRVAQLHPDRAGDARDPEALKVLNLRYSAALAFHRRHGCLPGPAVGAGAAQARASAMVAQAAGPRRAPRMRAALALLAAATLLAWTAATWTDTDPEAAAVAGAVVGPTAPIAPSPGAAHVAGPEVADRAQLPTPARLYPGMEAAAVRALLGDPIGRGEDDRLWVYGPSWLRFECDRLVAWYSSPLAPLKVPVAAGEDAPDTGRRRARSCARAAPDAGLPAALAGAAR